MDPGTLAGNSCQIRSLIEIAKGKTTFEKRQFSFFAKTMPIEQLISVHGYVVILIGTFLEGETVLVVGGFLGIEVT